MNVAIPNYIDLENKIKENNAKLIPSQVSRLLLLYDRPFFFIGDTCIHFARLKKLKSFYCNAVIDLNTVDPKIHKKAKTLLLNNPYINEYGGLSWENIKFENYDLIICASHLEEKFRDFFYSRYSDIIPDDSFSCAVFSGARFVGFGEDEVKTTFFPMNLEFIRFSLPETDDRSMRANEVFLDEGELSWADQWLMNSGMLENESLMIFLDNSTSREKLLRIHVYFDILISILQSSKNKVLIFDEQKIGKKHFYQKWLGPGLSKKVIFAEGLSLREALCLLGSSYTRLIFGPSTGLLHCASGIYNVFQQKGKLKNRIPAMIAYLGLSENNNFQEDGWWGGSMVNSILPVNTANTKMEVKSLKDINYKHLKDENKILPCSSFTAELITDYIKSNYADIEL